MLGHADKGATARAHYIRKDAVLVLDPRSLFDTEGPAESGSDAAGSA